MCNRLAPRHALVRAVGLALSVVTATACQPQPPPVPVQTAPPFRGWTYEGNVYGSAVDTAIGNQHEQTGGEVSEFRDYGTTRTHPDGGDERALAEVFSSDDGTTYWTSATAPSANLKKGTFIGSGVNFVQRQYFRVEKPGSKLSVLITGITVEIIDGSNATPNRKQCPELAADAGASVCEWVLNGGTLFDLSAYSLPAKKEFFSVGGGVGVHGWGGNWFFTADSDARTEGGIWDHSNFDEERDVDGDGGKHARLTLKRPIKIEIPLGSLSVNDEFELVAGPLTFASDSRQSETYISASFRDPQTAQGITLSYEGLVPVPGPDQDPFTPGAHAAPACPGAPDPLAGTLELGMDGLLVPETVRDALVPVTRTGGSHGAVSVTVRTVDGTATAGEDYVPVEVSVFFADGEEGTRVVRVPILGEDLIEPLESFQVTLSDPKGCAELGTRTSATITIADDDQPEVAPEQFTVGGTVSGLSGSGLVLRDTLGSETVAVSGDGPFTFPTPRLDATPYDVRVDTQPTNPLQSCTVAGGNGAVHGANVTNIAVTCTIPTPPGGLDPSFGEGGRAVTSVGYSPNLVGARIGMALQSDGKILLVGGLKLVRLNVDGTPDGTFGTAGAVDVVFNGGTFDTAMDVVVQSDGKIVVAGTTGTAVTGSDDFALTRFDSRGALDTTFGSGGHVTTDFFGSSDRVRRMRLQADEKILVVGSAFHPINPSQGSTLFAIARYNSDGTPDLGFAPGGKTTDSPGQVLSVANAVAIQSDGKIVVVGSTAPNGGEDPDTGVLRYIGDGQPKLPSTRDETFGPKTDGTLDAPVDQSLDVVLLSDGTILTAVPVRATFTGSGGVGFGLAHVPGRGVPGPRAPDPIVTFTNQSDFPKAMLQQANGQIVVVGQAGGFSTNPDMAIARFAAGGGPLDTNFGTGGRLTIDFFGGIESAEAVMEQLDHKLVIGGFARSGNAIVFVAARLLPEPSPAQ